ncbi:MAG: 5'/3'-nucleotidase SurE [Bacteroidota bacterium]
MNKKPLILVTNDDSIYSKGIESLIEVAQNFGEVIVVAPDKPQSGMGHAITINEPLRIQEYRKFGSIEAYTCTGTPVDCVKMGIYGILSRKPDLLLSGINHGANHSINVIYSGTMSAAVEGAVEKVPSIGFSLLEYGPDADFDASKEIASKIIEEQFQNGMRPGICLNVNIPKGKSNEIKGIRICRQGLGQWQDDFEKREDTFRRPYYWLAGSFKNLDKGEDTDSWALENNYVSVVPTQFDMTAHNEISELNNWNL